MLNLFKHLAYISQRKQELEKVDRHKITNDLIIKELELNELEKELNCQICEGTGEVDRDIHDIDGNICYSCDGTGRK